MKIFGLSTLIAAAMICPSSGGEGGIEVKLCGAFERPGTYAVNRENVHIQDIIVKARPVLLARKDVAMVVDKTGQRVIDLSIRNGDSILRGGEQVYLYERTIGRVSR